MEHEWVVEIHIAEALAEEGRRGVTFPVVEPVDACSVLAFRLSLARTVEHLMSPDKVLNDANGGNVPICGRSEPARRSLSWNNARVGNEDGDP